MSSQPRHVLVIGGGVIGIGCAHYLQQAGFRVSVAEKGTIGGACSHGNCGFVCPSHVLPLAEPGAVSSALKALLNPNGAFRIRPRLDPRLWSWLLKFARRCNHNDMVSAGHAIQPLLTSSLSLYQDLMRFASLECEWQKKGLLFVYRDHRALEAYEPVNSLLTSEFQESARRMNAAELLEFEPALKDNVAGAWYYEHDAHLRPDRLLASWRAFLEKKGVQFFERHELLGLEKADSQATSAKFAEQSIEADTFVVATGAWTPQLSEILGIRLPIEPGKGYSLTLPRSESDPQTPIMFPEYRVAVTPMQTSLRLGSIMEFAGYDSRLNQRRLRMLSASASQFMKQPLPTKINEEWFGWRPMTYDSVPIIGESPQFSNVILATGHNMLGLSMSTGTGKLVSELIAGQEPHLDPTPYSPHRFC